MKRLRTATTIVVALASITAGAAPALARGGDDHGGHGTPACTAGALTTGINRAPSISAGRVDRTAFACAGGWAYAGWITRGPHGVEITVVLHADDGLWKAENRREACTHHEVPQKIFNGACRSN
jgi:hypothetical protein